MTLLSRAYKLLVVTLIISGGDVTILVFGDPGAVSRDDTMLVVKVYCKIETSPWALTLTEPVPEAFELPASDWQEIFFFLWNWFGKLVNISAQGLVSILQ